MTQAKSWTYIVGRNIFKDSRTFLIFKMIFKVKEPLVGTSLSVFWLTQQLENFTLEKPIYKKFSIIF